MTTQIHVLLGPAGSGKTEELLTRYCHSLNGGGPGGFGRSLWLAPTGRAAEHIREQLAGRLHSACLAPGVTTFIRLADEIVAAAPQRRRRISRPLERELLRRVVASASETRQLAFFAAAAQRAGFVDLLMGHFRELRQRAVSPQAYSQATAQRGAAARPRELAALYALYMQQLDKHQLLDAPGVPIAARDALAAGTCPLYRDLDLLVVDGFTDFTHIEFDTLRQLAARARAVCISLPCDSAPATAHKRRSETLSVERAELFAKPTATLHALERVFPQLSRQTLPRRPAANAALGYLADQIFRHPPVEPPQPVLDALPAVEIVAAASAHDEIVQIARRIKRLLTRPAKSPAQPFGSPTQPSDIVVVFRSVADAAPRVAEVFTRFGIPHAIESAPPVATAAVFRTLRNLLLLAIEDWPFRRVVGVVTNNTLTAIEEAGRRDADWLIRDLQIASGREALLATVAALAAQQPDVDKLSEHEARRVVAATQAITVLQKLATALAQLPTAATALSWAAALERLGKELGLFPFGVDLAAGQRTEQSLSIDPIAWKSIAAHLRALEQLDTSLGACPRLIDRDALLTLLTEFGNKQSLPRLQEEAGRVRVLSAQSVRGLSVRHVFLAGLSEQAFPAAPQSGQLASDSDYRLLSGSPRSKKGSRGELSSPEAAPASTHSQDEMLLFHEVVTRARESLTLSYPAMDDKAQELPPSPYVIELERLFRHSDRQIHRARPQLSPIPHALATRDDGKADTAATATRPALPTAEIFSIADWRILATSEAAQTDGDARLLAGLFKNDTTRRLGQAIDSGIRIIHARARGEKFGACEGVLISPAVAARLAKRFGSKHTWSPSQFETYAACPYKFFLQSVLGLEPLGDLTLETDFARRGSLMHRVLAAFHRKYGASPSDWSAVWRDEARFSAELKRALSAAFAGSPREGIDAALLELDRRQIDKWTDAYRDQHEKYHAAWSKLAEPLTPTHFELRFGRKHAGEEEIEDPNSVDNSFRLDIGGEKIHIAGRIDRIDVGRAGGRTVFNVIDYKSGRRPTLTGDKIESGERLQPALYVMAAQALVFGDDAATPLWTGYWSMQNGVTTHKSYSLHCSVESGEATDAWEDLKPKVIARIGEIVRAARRGDFPIASRDVHCASYCDFRTVCRVAQVRSVGKIWEPAGDA
ncbi:MAG: PD-(D/E)XK nuclease family protein [Pirellulales bacterium]